MSIASFLGQLGECFLGQVFILFFCFIFTLLLDIVIEGATDTGSIGEKLIGYDDGSISEQATVVWYVKWIAILYSIVMLVQGILAYAKLLGDKGVKLLISQTAADTVILALAGVILVGLVVLIIVLSRRQKALVAKAKEV